MSEVLQPDAYAAPGPRVIWQPLPGSQSLATACPADIILLSGTRGGGKTDWQLFKYRMYVGLGYGRFWRGVIFDRNYKDLDDLIEKSLRWFYQFDDGARFLHAKSDYRWVWPTGEQLLFRHIKKDSDYYSYHGQEFPYQGWNELTKHGTSNLFDSMFSCNRSSFLPEVHSPINPKTKERELLPPIPLMVTATTNPHGIGHHWVKKRFIDKGAPGEVIRTRTRIFSPKLQRRVWVEKTQTWLFSTYKENPFLDDKYIAELERIKDENKRKAWLLGDWNIATGARFSKAWNERYNVIPRFPIPKQWPIVRALDWGSAKPFSYGLWAIANGEEAQLADGRIFCPRPKSIIRIDEWYGCELDEFGELNIGANVGIDIGSTEFADKVLAKEASLLLSGWIQTAPLPGPADNSIQNTGDRDTDSTAKLMASRGLYWAKSDKSAGSRVDGHRLLDERLRAAATEDGPALYCMEHCKAFRAIISTAPRDESNPDDVDTDSEDHIIDETRYMVLSGCDPSAFQIVTTFPR